MLAFQAPTGMPRAAAALLALVASLAVASAIEGLANGYVAEAQHAAAGSAAASVTASV
jgi:hypothetical protein